MILLRSGENLCGQHLVLPYDYDTIVANEKHHS
jgi:hypothetical protein